MLPQFSATTAEQPIRTDAEGQSLMPEWSDADVAPAKVERKKREPKILQPDATQLESVDSVVTAAKWLKEHPEEAKMLQLAQLSSSGDILADAGVEKRYYASAEAAAFFDKSVQWLYWGMRPLPKGGELFIRPILDQNGAPMLDANGEVLTEPIPVERLGDKRRFDIETIREFAKSAYYRANIKEPKLHAVLQRLVVAERGGNWKAIPIPKKGDGK